MPRRSRACLGRRHHRRSRGGQGRGRGVSGEPAGPARAHRDLPSRERLLAAAEPRDQPLLVVLARLELDFPEPPRSSYPLHYAEIASLLRPRDELDDLGVEGLAEQIEPGREGYDPQRIRAMDRCERQRGRMLYPVFYYGRGVTGPVWAKLLAACRTGQPAWP